MYIDILYYLTYCTHYIPSVLICICTINKDYYRQRLIYIYFRWCPEFIFGALHAVNVNCIKLMNKTLLKIQIRMRGPLDRTTNDDDYLWTQVAEKGDVDLLKCLFSYGLDKDTTDEFGHSILWHVVRSGNIEAVHYLLELGVTIPTYPPKERKVRCEWCKKKKMIIEGNKKSRKDPCIIAICRNKLEIIKLLDEYGSKSCKSFFALRCACNLEVWMWCHIYLINTPNL